MLADEVAGRLVHDICGVASFFHIARPRRPVLRPGDEFGELEKRAFVETSKRRGDARDEPGEGFAGPRAQIEVRQTDQRDIPLVLDDTYRGVVCNAPEPVQMQRTAHRSGEHPYEKEEERGDEHGDGGKGVDARSRLGDP